MEEEHIVVFSPSVKPRIVVFNIPNVPPGIGDEQPGESMSKHICEQTLTVRGSRFRFVRLLGGALGSFYFNAPRLISPFAYAHPAEPVCSAGSPTTLGPLHRPLATTRHHSHHWRQLGHHHQEQVCAHHPFRVYILACPRPTGLRHGHGDCRPG